MNYYELLGVDKNAEVEDIELRIDKNYNKWRSLVTHYDASVVSEANQALSLLETMRGTLLNVEKRKKYDQQLENESGNVAGVSDPEIKKISSQWFSGAPPRSEPANNGDVASEILSSYSWVCQKCEHPNAIMTKFCRNCGDILGINCPKCGDLSYVNNVYCESCGVNIPEEIEKIEREREIAEKEWEEFQKHEAEITPYKQEVDSIKSLSSLWWSLLALVGFGIVPIITYTIAFFKATKFLKGPQNIGSAEFRDDVKTARVQALVPLIILTMIYGSCLICSVASIFSDVLAR